jgi:hypothetical protein
MDLERQEEWLIEE